MRKLLLSTILATLALAAPAIANPVITVTDVSVQGDVVTITGPISPVSVYGRGSESGLFGLHRAC